MNKILKYADEHLRFIKSYGYSIEKKENSVNEFSFPNRNNWKK